MLFSDRKYQKHGQWDNVQYIRCKTHEGREAEDVQGIFKKKMGEVVAIVQL